MSFRRPPAAPPSPTRRHRDMDANALKELKRKCEEASGPDRQIDLRIKIATAAWMFAGGATAESVVRAVGGDLHDAPPHYTGSLDAALALWKRLLPGRTYHVDATCPEAGIDWFWLDTAWPRPKRDEHRGTGATEALACNVAGLAALIHSQEPSNA